TGSSAKVGGLIGYTQGGSLQKSYTNTTLTATGSSVYAGGLVGQSATTISQCYASGSVKASGDNSYTGGLIGYATYSVNNSYATTNVTGTLYTAGLVGYTKGGINRCYAMGDINGVMYGAGVVGELDGSSAKITNCVAANNLLTLTAQSSWGCRVIGGFKNGASEPDNSNYALSTMQVSLNGVPQNKTDDNIEGIAKTQVELMTSATYEGLGWNMNSVWSIDEGESYPYLQWEANLNPVVSISLDNTSLIISEGKTTTITATILPQDATNKRLTWTSSNNAVATVADGVVTAVGQGTATITAKSTDGSNITATCQVTVVANLDEAIAELQALVDEAQDLYDNSTEGDDIGQYAPGSRDALLAVINSVRDQISSTMDEETISDCMEQLNNAIALFESQRVTPGEDTDYSVIDNTLYIERVEASAGGQVTISIKMKNTVEIQGYQFDLYLPDGVTVAKNANGKAMVSLSTERTTTDDMDYFKFNLKPDGHLTVMCASTEGYTFEGSDGEVARVTLDVSDNMEEGEYAIVLKDVALTDANAIAHETEYLKSTLEVFTYKLGDVNADTKINVADFVAVANHILGNTPSVFIYKAADVNKDTKINVADFVGIANMILNGVTSANLGRMMLALKRADSVIPTDIDELDNAIYIDPAIAAQGSQQVLSVRMKNAGEVVGFQFQVQLPEGLTFENAVLSTERTTTDKTDYFKYKIQQDGSMIVFGSSTGDTDTGEMNAIDGNDGEIVRITINIPADFEAGEYAIHVLNGVLTDSESASIELEADITSLLTVEESDGKIYFSETDTSLPSFTVGEQANVSVTRTINANEWSTICLPFGMTATQIEDAFPETSVQLADFIGCGDPELDDEEEVMSFSFIFSTNVTEIEPNHPYLIKVDKKVESFDVEGVTITPSDDLGLYKDEIKYRVGGRWVYDYNSFIGTYEAQTVVPEDCLFLNGNKFWYSTGATKMKAFRGYFYSYNMLGDAYKNAANSNVSLTFNDAEGIVSVKVGGQPTEGTYDLQGRKVTGSLKKGIYIVDGKKMVIK
ncbi:MAG: Ig-like domain-containing protein, partial [Prevotella sp.]|nr:Ig-like domain-containing protein [Prevotella sp.]